MAQVDQETQAWDKQKSQKHINASNYNKVMLTAVLGITDGTLVAQVPIWPWIISN